MNIREILNKHYEEFLSMCTHTDKAIYGGKTSEDILNDSIITIINHFGDSEVSEEEGYEYAKKTFLFECTFAYKKKAKEVEKMIEYVGDLKE